MSRHMTFLNRIYMALKSDYGLNVQMLPIFPFSRYPYIVIFDNNYKQSDFTQNSLLKANMFVGNKVLYVMMEKDFCEYGMIRGVAQLQIRLLEKLGFKVIIIKWYELSGIEKYAFKRKLKSYIN